MGRKWWCQPLPAIVTSNSGNTAVEANGANAHALHTVVAKSAIEQLKQP